MITVPDAAKTASADASTFPEAYRANTYFPGLGGLLLTTFAAQHSEEARTFMESLVPDEAKYIPGTPLVTVVNADPGKLDSAQTIYKRPNGEDYHARKWGEHQDVQVLRNARENKLHVYLRGEPGCGKTACAEAAFPDLVTIMGHGDITAEDFLGQWVPKPGGGWEWVDGPLIVAVEQGLPLLIDEIGLIDTKVLSLIYGLMDGRDELQVTLNQDRGTIKAKEGFFIIGATNPKAPGVRMSEALLSRFKLHAQMTTDWDIARRIFGVPRELVSAAQNLNAALDNRTVSWAPQMRELISFMEVEKTYGTEFAVQNLMAQAPENDRAEVQRALSNKYGDMALPARI